MLTMLYINRMKDSQLYLLRLYWSVTFQRDNIQWPCVDPDMTLPFHNLLHPVSSSRHRRQVSSIYWQPHNFPSQFQAKFANVGFLILPCGLLVRCHWAELKYGRILAVGVRGYELSGQGFWAMTEFPVFLVLKLAVFFTLLSVGEPVS